MLSDGSIMSPNLLIFDMGHVFVDFDWEDICREFCVRANSSRSEFEEVLKYLGSLGYEKGNISTVDFLSEANQKLKTNVHIDEFHKIWNKNHIENSEMAALLQKLKTERPLYLLSNTNESHWHYLENNFRVSRHFEERILSFQVHASKPDKKIYEEVLKRSGRLASECLFVDDLEENIQAAKNIGMQGIRFQGIDHLKKELALHGIFVKE